MKIIPETDTRLICDIEAPCFKLLTPEEAKLINGSKTQVIYRKGDHLTKQGTFGSYVLFIAKGLVRQYIEDDSSRDFNLRLIPPGEFVGLSVIFGGNTFNYSSVAITECLVYLIEKDALANILQHNGQFSFNLIQRYVEQNDILINSLRHVIFKQMNGRMADILLYIESVRHENEKVFHLLSRKDIADFAAVSTESAVKVLKSFERDGTILLEEKNIRILDPEKLREISRRG